MTEYAPKRVGLITTIMFMYFIAPDAAIVASLLGEVGKSYPDIPLASITYLRTIANIGAVIGAALCGVIAGRHIKYRTLTVTALFLIGFCGGAQVFLSDEAPFALMLILRVASGIGLGCVMPIVQSMITFVFSDADKRARWFGIGNVVFNIGSTIGTTAAGFLCLISWHVAFGFYFIAFIPMVLSALFMIEPEKIIDAEPPREKMRFREMPPIVVFFFLFLTCSLLLGSSMNLNLSTALTQIGVSPAFVGTAMSMFPLGACVAAVSFGFVYGRFKTQTMTLGVACALLGHGINFSAASQGEPTIALFYIGVFVVGMGVNFVSLSIPMTLSVLVNPRIVTAALGFGYVFQNLGSFLGSPFSQMVMAVAPTGAPIRFVWIGSMALGVVLMTISLLTGMKTSRMVSEKVEQTKKEEKQTTNTEADPLLMN